MLEITERLFGNRLEKQKEIREKVLLKMIEKVTVETDQATGVTKYRIPDELLNGSARVKVDGKDYNIWNVPGVKGHAASIILEAITDEYCHVKTPSWSQIFKTYVYWDEINHYILVDRAIFIV